LLTGGGRTALARHQTLQATIDWSYALLVEPERLLLQRLSVFAGGCTLEAAEAVCAGEGLPAADMLDCLTALVDKSLISGARQQGQETRYRLLEMVRQYAWEKLAVGGAQERTQMRHRDYFLSFAEKHAPNLNHYEFLSRRRAIDTDLENIRRALEWSFSNRTAITAGVRLVLVAVHQLYSLEEKLDWCTRAIALAESEPDIPDDLLVELLLLARTYVVVDDPRAALALTERALEISRGLGRERPVLQLDSLCRLAELYITLLEDAERGQATLAEARKLFESSESDLRSPSKEGWQAWFCQIEFQLAFSRGDFLGAEAWAVEIIRRETELGSPWGIMMAQRAMGSACLGLGKHAEARRHFLLALDSTEMLSRGYWQSLRAALIRQLGEVDLREGELESAWQNCQQSLRLAAEAFDRNVIASGLGLAAAIAAGQGRPARAARLSGASIALYARQSRKPLEDSSLDTLLPGWQASPDHAAVAEAFEAGQAMPAEAAIASALDEAAD
ncbi:MAG: hypothetical protein ABI847_11245, partial [Anaerolineales bacterium]